MPASATAKGTSTRKRAAPPRKRTPAPELARAVELASKPQETASSKPALATSAPATAEPNEKPKVYQINFLVTEHTARIISKLATQAGSTRRLFARLLKEAGQDIPEDDLNPRGTKKRRFV
jgi:hypothetical protein